MENRFLGLIENSIKEHWDLPAFSDYNGHIVKFNYYKTDCFGGLKWF